MTLKEFFDKYPVTVAGFARYMGKDRQWLNSRIIGVQTLRPDDIKLINETLLKLSSIFKKTEIQ